MTKSRKNPLICGNKDGFVKRFFMEESNLGLIICKKKYNINDVYVCFYF